MTVVAKPVNYILRNIARRRRGQSTLALPTLADVKIVEVGARDGLQNEPTLVSASDKVTLIQRLVAAGCRHVEAGSFVSPKWVPSMSNTAEVMQALQQWRTHNDTLAANDDLVLSCLVPNVKGLAHAVESRTDEIAIFGAASESFSQRNINCSIEESLQRFESVAAQANEARLPVRGYLSCVIACPYEGHIKPSQVARIVERMLEMGCHEVSLGDTIGVGTPATTAEMLSSVLSVANTDQLAVHFHDTYGQALANILHSLERGIFKLDSSVAGLGGCPYARGASGNVATEDVVYMLDGLGVHTGVDLERLVDAAQFILDVLGTTSRSRAGQALAARRQAMCNAMEE